MKTKSYMMAAAILSLLLIRQPARAQNEAADRTALRELREALVNAITSGNSDGVIKHAHPNITVTWQNNEVCRGHAGLRDFFGKSTKSKFQAYRKPPTPDELTILFSANTGVAFGETIAEYVIFGKRMEMKSRWTATAVKEEGSWKLAAYHVSMNVLDNPLLGAAKAGLYVAGGAALAVGLRAGILIGRRRKTTATPAARPDA